MKSECQEISPTERQLDVVIDGDAILKELNRAYGRVGRQVRIPGFRQGKVPRQVLERHYKAEVENDVLSKLINDSYGEAVGEHKLHPVNQPRIDNQEFIPGQDFRYSARIEVQPEVVLNKYTGLSVAKVEAEFDDKVVEEELLRQQGYHAQVLPIEDRDLVEAGDLVVCNFTGTVDGEKFQGGSGQGFTIDTGAEEFIPEIVSALVGKKLNEAFELDFTLAEDFKNEDVAGKEAHFEVTPIQLKRKQLPELDDEFAKDLGDFESLEDWRTKTREDLQFKADEDAKLAFRDNVVKALIEANPVDVPPTMIERQLDLMVYQNFGGIPVEQLRKMGLDPNKLREDMRDTALLRVRKGMLLETIADKEEIEISKDQLDAKFVELAERLKQPEKKIRAAYKGEHIDELKFNMRLDKALDLVIAKLDGAEPELTADEDKASKKASAKKAPAKKATAKKATAKKATAKKATTKKATAKKTTTQKAVTKKANDDEAKA